MIPSKRAELKKRVIDIVNTPPPEDLAQASLSAPETFARAKARAGEKVAGYQMPGFERLTRATGGLRPNGFTVICGPTGTGKTTLLANLWIQFTSDGKILFTAPVENGKEDFMDMLVSIVSRKSRLDLTSHDWEEVRQKYLPTFFSNRQNVFSNHESRVSHLDLLTDIYYNHLTKGTQIALCDNWQFMSDFSDDRNAMAKSDKALHECVVFTKHVPVHIFMVMHPKKTEGGRVESEFDIKGSSTAVQEAHNVWLFNRLKNEKDAPPLTVADFCREISVAKARYNGRSVGSKIIYSLDPVCELYSEYKTAQ